MSNKDTSMNHPGVPRDAGDAPILKARGVSNKFTDKERKSFAQEVRNRFCPAFEKLAQE